MNKHLDKTLREAFPELYRDNEWGFPSDGWFLILWRLSEKLDALDSDCHVLQVKEKFGTLRFYLSIYPTGARELVEAAEAESAVTCEKCGRPGNSDNGRSWIKVLCEECNAIH